MKKKRNEKKQKDKEKRKKRRRRRRITYAEKWLNNARKIHETVR